MVLHCTSLLLRMHLHLDMAGHCRTLCLIVHVARPSVWTMLYPVAGGFPTIRHNEVRDLTARLLSEVCHNVTTEPHLQPLTGESMRHRSAITTDNARLDVSMCGFWGGRFEKAFIDVRVFNPSAASNRSSSLTATYK